MILLLFHQLDERDGLLNELLPGGYLPLGVILNDQELLAHEEINCFANDFLVKGVLEDLPVDFLPDQPLTVKNSNIASLITTELDIPRLLIQNLCNPLEALELHRGYVNVVPHKLLVA